MHLRNFGSFIASCIAFTLLLLLAFGALQWLQVPAGRLLDWLVGIASFWWLLVIVTVPWNIHFQAREVLSDAATSRMQGLSVRAEDVAYATTWVRRSLLIAVALHVLSAAGLYMLAASGISAVGYISSGAALLLTGLRPVVRGYEYIAARLAAIRHALRYPREDVVMLRTTLDQLVEQVKGLDARLAADDPQSWAARQQAAIEEVRHEVYRLRATTDELRATNQTDHERLARETQHAVAQITADGQFLDHARELIRFFKQA